MYALLFQDGPFFDGYFAAMSGDDRNPHSIFSLQRWPWALGNEVGGYVHRAAIEAVYLNTPDE